VEARSVAVVVRIGAILGGPAGMRFHRRVDTAASVTDTTRQHHLRPSPSAPGVTSRVDAATPPSTTEEDTQ
jgi:hypothetical protein